MTKLKITNDTIIKDITDNIIGASEVFLSFNIPCATCSKNQNETLQEGVLSHGFSNTDLNNIKKELSKLQIKSHFPINIQDFYISILAYQKLLFYRGMQKNNNVYLKIEDISPVGIDYEIDFKLNSPKNTKIYNIKDDLKLYISNRDLKLLKNHILIYISNPYQEGFNIIKI